MWHWVTVYLNNSNYKRLGNLNIKLPGAWEPLHKDPGAWEPLHKAPIVIIYMVLLDIVFIWLYIKAYLLEKRINLLNV